MKKIGTGLRRSFAVTSGLQQGYGETGTIHTMDEAEKAIRGWMMAKATTGLDFLTGTLSAGQVVYAWLLMSGTADSGSEPVAIFSGEVSVLYNANLSDESVEELLDELAGEMAAALGQTRVYVTCRDEAWVLQAEETVTPTGETV